MTDQNSHAQILETPSVADPTVFDPQLAHAQKLFAITLSPEKVRVSFESRNDVVATDLGEDPFLLGPHPGAIGPRGLADARVEEVAPVLAVVVFQGVHVVLDIKEATRSRAIDDLVERVRFVVVIGRWVWIERHVFGGETVGVSWVAAASLVADVFISGAAGFGDGYGFWLWWWWRRVRGSG